MMDELNTKMWMDILLSVIYMTSFGAENDIILLAARGNQLLDIFLRCIIGVGFFAVITDGVDFGNSIDKKMIILSYSMSLMLLKCPQPVHAYGPVLSNTFRAVSLTSSLATAITAAKIYLDNFSRLLTEPLFHCVFVASLLMLALNIATILYALPPRMPAPKKQKPEDKKN
jgi:hypothetical protein